MASPFLCGVNPFTTGNPFLGTKLLGFSMGRSSGVLKGLSSRAVAIRYYVNQSMGWQATLRQKITESLLVQMSYRVLVVRVAQTGC